MTHAHKNGTLPGFRVLVYRAGDFTVISGANLGDQIADAHHLELADVYGLRAQAAQIHLSIAPDASGASCYSIARTSEIGTPGAALHLDCVATFMAEAGAMAEAIIMVETLDGLISEIYLLPLAPIVPKQSYTLINIDRTVGASVLAQLACSSFSRGTHVLCAGGIQIRIEDLYQRPPDLTQGDSHERRDLIQWHQGKGGFDGSKDYAKRQVRRRASPGSGAVPGWESGATDVGDCPGSGWG